MDSINMVAFQLASASPDTAGASVAGSGAAGSLGTPAVFDVARFDAAYAAAAPSAAPAATAVPKVSGTESQGFRSVVEALQGLNGHAESIGTKAMQMRPGEMKPGDMLMMTMKAHEFLFHCELTSNVANRTSEGVQQLFREQT